MPTSIYNPPPLDRWLTTEEAAALLSFSPTTLAHWRFLERGPAWLRIGGPNGPVRYSLHALQEWMRAQVPLSQRRVPRRERWLKPEDAARVLEALRRLEGIGEG